MILTRNVNLIDPRGPESLATAIGVLMHRLGNEVAMSGGEPSWGEIEITTLYDHKVLQIRATVPVFDSLPERHKEG